LVVAAIITPTTDIFNMMVFAIPMMLLYEVGIILARLVEHRRKKTAREIAVANQ
jgi:sec-independent protein translocase protein TatC